MKKILLLLLGITILSAYTCEVSARPKPTSPATSAAIKLYKSGNYTQSYLTFSNIVKKDPSNALAYYYLGMSSVQLGKKDEAMKNYEKAISLSPEKGLLASYAKLGLRCIDDPVGCRNPLKDESGDNEEDKFIKSSFGSGLSDKARGVYEQQKIQNIMREINRSDEIAPQKFKDYKDFSSQAPSNEEISAAIQTLQKAGFNDMITPQGYNSDLLYMLSLQNNESKNNPDYQMMNLLMNNRGLSNLNPQVIQTLLTNQMTSSF